MDTVPVEHNISRPDNPQYDISRPPNTHANAIKNYAPPRVSQHKRKKIGPGGIAFMVGGGTLMATGVALLVAIRLNKLHPQSPSLKKSESNHSSLHSHPTSATIGNSYRNVNGL